MKKIKRIIFAILIAVITTSNLPMVNAKTDKVIVDRNVTIRVVKVWNGKWINTSEELIYRESDGKYVYCLQPGVLIEDGAIVTGYSDEASQLQLINLSREQLRRINLIAYYGYGYEGHNSIDWYFATQFLIWSVTETENIPYPAASDSGLERSSKYDAMFNEINALVNAHPENVSFANNTYDMKVGETKRITDTSKVLSKFYEVKSNDALDMKIEGNDLVVTAKKGYEGTINLDIKENNNVPLIYDGAKQICLTAGDPTFKSASLKFVVNTEVKLNKTYGNSNKGVYQKEEGAEFEIYDENTNKLIKTIVTDIDGNSIIYLKPGKYRIHQTKGKETYKLVDDYIFTIDGSRIKEVIYFQNEKIKSDLVFKKTDFSTDVGLPNTLIEIYDAETDKLIFSGRTDNDGQIIIKNMEYGKYYILEKEAPKGYELNPEKMYFEITKDGEVIKCNMKDKKLPEEEIEKKTVKVPDTMTDETRKNLVAGLTCILVGTILILYVKTFKKKK